MIIILLMDTKKIKQYVVFIDIFKACCMKIITMQDRPVSNLLLFFIEEYYVIPFSFGSFDPNESESRRLITCG